MTENEIFEIIRLDNMPVWELYATSGYTHRHVGSYDNDLQGVTENEKIDGAINALKQRLALLPSENHFYIKLKTAKRANQTGVQEHRFSRAYSNQNQLAGVPQPETESKHIESYLSGQIELIKRENELSQRNLLEQFEIKQKAAEIERQRAELNELRERYTSKQELITGALENILGRFLQPFLVSQKPIAGTPETDNEETDEKAKLLESFASELYESKSIDEIKNIVDNVKNYNQNQSTANKTNDE